MRASFKSYYVIFKAFCPYSNPIVVRSTKTIRMCDGKLIMLTSFYLVYFVITIEGSRQLRDNGVLNILNLGSNLREAVRLRKIVRAVGDPTRSLASQTLAKHNLLLLLTVPS